MRPQVGDRIGHWTLVGEARDKALRRMLVCRCVCGREKRVAEYALVHGVSKSCGCERRSRLRHGYTRKGKVRPEWQAWNHMKQRCYNRNDKHYKDYGGRGVRVCERWRNSFDTFLKDMGDRPSPRHSLDRFPNSDGNYKPGNVRWATQVEQSRNRRTVIWIEFNGSKRCAAEWSRLTGIKRQTIQSRYHRGWTPDRILSPVA